MGGLTMREAVYRPRAAYDIESATVYLGEVLDRPRAARAWYASLVEAVALLCEFPDLGCPFEDERLAVKGRRTYLVGDHRLFYSHDDDVLTIWRVVHAREDIDDYAIVDLRD